MKFKAIILIFTLIGVASSCSNPEPNVVTYGSGQKYILNKDTEKSIALTQELSDEFKSLCKGIKAQVPLNKVVESESYKAYIGIPLKANSARIIESLKNDSTHQSLKLGTQSISKVLVQKALSSRDSISTLYLSYDIKQSNSSFLIIFASKDSLFTVSKFNDENFINSKIKFE